MPTEKSRYLKCQRLLTRYGYRLSKGRPRYKSQLNMGMYQIRIQNWQMAMNTAGNGILPQRPGDPHYDATIEKVEEFLKSCQDVYRTARI